MINFNLGNSHIILEKDKSRLDKTIRVALFEAQEMIRSHYMHEHDVVPDLDVTIGYGIKNAAQVVYQFLDCPKSIVLNEGYLDFIDKLLCEQSHHEFDSQLLSELCFWDQKKIHRFSTDYKYLSVAKNAYRLVFMSLNRQQSILLAPQLSKYMPVSRLSGSELSPFGLEIMTDVVRDLCALHYPDIDSGVDWTLSTYPMNKLAQEGRLKLIGLALCTTWRKFEDINLAGIEEMRQFARLGTIGQFLTYFFLKFADDESMIDKIFPIVDQVRRLRIYTEIYDKWAMLRLHRRAGKKRYYKIGADHSGILQKEVFTHLLGEAIQNSVVDGNLDGISLAEKLWKLPKKSANLDIANWPKETILPNYISFNWIENTEQWVRAMNYYMKNNNYENPASAYNSLQPFVYYLTVYLPIYFHYNTNCSVVYPINIGDFKGCYFISRPPIVSVDGSWPTTYADYIKSWHTNNDKYCIYESMRSLSSFFDHIIARRELLGISETFVNPVLPTDIPPSGGRRYQTEKTRLPDPVYWLFLLYCYRLFDYIKKINSKIIEDRNYSHVVSRWCRKTSSERPYLIDIRDLQGIDFERSISFDG